jgi:outer membrane lipoprotein-sorting protein
MTVMVFAAVLVPALLGGFQSKDIESYCQPGLRDLAFTGKVVKAKVSEAAKIDNDYKRNLSFQNFKVVAKEPFKLRLDMQADDTTFVYLVNGNTQVTRIPKLKINQKVDVTNEPGRKQTFLEFGMLTPTVATKFFQSKFVRFDRETGNPVFDLTWPEKFDNTSRMRIWIDKDEKYIVRREWYGQVGQLKATILFSKPVKEAGVAFPTIQQTFNAENKLAAEFHYSSVKINDGVSDALFSL